MLKILFLCVANSARSQMAEGIARTKLGSNVEVFSAGSNPKNINPLAIDAMQEIGIDISNYHAKSINTIDFANIDVIVTLCAEEICPIVLGDHQKYHWPLPDPANQLLSHAEQIKFFRHVRDDLVERILLLKKTLKLE